MTNMIRYLFYGIILLLLTLTSAAQENIEAETLVVGSIIQGRIDDATPRVVYRMEGSRGLVVRFTLEASDGNLDPVLTIFTANGDVLFRRDDTQGSRNVETTLTFEENGLVYLVIGRFGYSLGSTSGDYELSIERIGVLSQQGTNLQYGIPITDTITNTQPQIYYTFQANAGDILTIEMVRSSGTLDPMLQIVDSNRFLIVENDDADGDTRNSRIDNLVIPETGTYIIVATRYGEATGESVGSFVLIIGEGANSGLGNNRQSPQVIFLNQTIKAELTEEQFQRYYQFTAERDQIVTITMERARFPGQLDAYLILTNAGYQPLIENDDGGSGTNARIASFRIPATGQYNIIATRFGRSEGDTFGEFNLTLQDNGFAFDDVESNIPRLLYGTTVQDVINDDDSESLYVFWGTIGDVVTISMDKSTGDLDAVLELLDNNQVRMLRDDDSGANQNARIEHYILTYTGVHYIRASRYEGSGRPTNTTGDFNLSLTRILNN
ncbi:MAG: PPC domain-containing protein [Anaerolineae bacterium]|nr:PPC domain-containing protein [Anaerolineae bacterium]MDQ7036687.1 PPC domain-containing protein [Anaerolineae bacterium]